jgi:hypothetical protein
MGAQSLAHGDRCLRGESKRTGNPITFHLHPPPSPLALPSPPPPPLTMISEVYVCIWEGVRSGLA